MATYRLNVNGQRRKVAGSGPVGPATFLNYLRSERGAPQWVGL